jgi:hypothetical protein
MSDDKPTKPEACDTGSGFFIPGTQDVSCDGEADLQHCVHCGASLSQSTEFCQVCATEVSGGEHTHETGEEHTHDA